MGTLFDLDGTAYGRMEVHWPALLLIGLVALHSAYAKHVGDSGRRGLNTAGAALVLLVVFPMMRWWLKDGHDAADFQSVTLTVGFHLGALAYLLLSVGMILFGAPALRRR